MMSMRNADASDGPAVEFLLAEHRHFTESLWRIDDAGERRVNLFVTLMVAALAGLVALIRSERFPRDTEGLSGLLFGALFVLLVVGWMTRRQIQHYARARDEATRAIDLIRSRFRDLDGRLEDYQPTGRGRLAVLSAELIHRGQLQPGPGGGISGGLREALQQQGVTLSPEARITPLASGWLIADRGLAHTLWRERGQLRVFEVGPARGGRISGLEEIVLNVNGITVAALVLTTLWRLNAGWFIFGLWRDAMLATAGIVAFLAAREWQRRSSRGRDGEPGAKRA